MAKVVINFLGLRHAPSGAEFDISLEIGEVWEDGVSFSTKNLTTGKKGVGGIVNKIVTPERFRQFKNLHEALRHLEEFFTH